MNTSFELWDVETANIVGAFDTEEEAIEVVRGLLDSYGIEFGEDLCLFRRFGSEESRIVAESKDLIALATTDRRATVT